MLVVAGIHREDGDVRAVFEQVLVEVCTEEVEDALVVVVHRGDEIVLVCGRVFHDGSSKLRSWPTSMAWVFMPALRR